jgi:hypothetical protein
MVTKKDRRHNGWVIPALAVKCPKKILIDQCIEPQPFWDDWMERRDGMRSPVDKTKIRNPAADTFGHLEIKKYNRKLKRELKIREARKMRLNIKQLNKIEPCKSCSKNEICMLPSVRIAAEENKECEHKGDRSKMIHNTKNMPNSMAKEMTKRIVIDTLKGKDKPILIECYEVIDNETKR